MILKFTAFVKVIHYGEITLKISTEKSYAQTFSTVLSGEWQTRS
jgi:hypothetical protein